MAISNRFQQSELVDMVRTLIQQYTNIKISEEEIVEVLNVKQLEIFLLMPRDMKKFWFGDIQSLVVALDATTNYYAASFPNNLWDIVGIKRYWTDTDDYRRDLKQTGLESLEEFLVNQFLDEEAYAIHGTKFYFTYTSSPDGTVVLFFVREPTDMASDTDYMDLPDPFVSLLNTLTATAIVAAAEIDADEKQTAMQIFAMLEKAAREAAGLPLQSEVEDKEALNAAGIPGGTPRPPGGGKGGDHPIID